MAEASTSLQYLLDQAYIADQKKRYADDATQALLDEAWKKENRQSQILKPGEYVEPASGQIKSLVANSQDPAIQVLNKLNEPFESAGTAAGQFVQGKVQPYVGNTGSDIAGALTSGTVQTLGPSLALRGIMSGAKALTQAAGKFFVPGATRTAGVEAGMEKLGAVPNAIDRAYKIPASKSAYAIAEAQPPLPVNPILDAIESVKQQTGKALPNRPALRQLTETQKNIVPPLEVPQAQGAPNMQAFLANKDKAANQLIENLRKQPTEVSYRDVMNEVKGLRSQAEMAFRKGNTTAGMTLSQGAAAMLDKMDEISPAIKAANQTYRREQSVEKIAKVLSNPRPDVKLGELFLKDQLVKGVIPKGDAEFLQKIAGEISTMGTQASPYSGVGAKVVNLISTPVAKLMTSDAGRYLLRQTFKEGKMSREGVVALMQLIRTSELPGVNDQ